MVRTTAQRRTVTHACPLALDAAVTAGMTLAHARALIHHDRVLELPHEPERDASALTALARWASRWSPIVRAEPPDALLLDITGCPHLFGGEAALAHQVRDTLGTLGFTARVAVASTVGAAWALAHWAPAPITLIQPAQERRALAPLPIAALRVDPDADRALGEVGVTTIAQLLDLPRATLPARYGHDLLRRLDQALGSIPEPVHGLSHDDPLVLTMELPGGTTQWESVAHALRAMIDQLIPHLRRREGGVRRLAVRFGRIDAPPAELTLDLTRPTRARSHLWALLRPKLERLNLARGIERVELHALHTAPILHEQHALGAIDAQPAPHHASAELARVLEAIAARLGGDRVRRAQRHPSHRPERAFATTPALTDENDTLARTPARPVAPPMARPTTLLDPPEDASVVALMPEGPLARLAWRGETHALITCLGPERLGGQWWLARESSRDYYRVQTSGGLWLWIFHEPAASVWRVHGVWA